MYANVIVERDNNSGQAYVETKNSSFIPNYWRARYNTNPYACRLSGRIRHVGVLIIEYRSNGVCTFDFFFFREKRRSWRDRGEIEVCVCIRPELNGGIIRARALRNVTTSKCSRSEVYCKTEF